MKKVLLVMAAAGLLIATPSCKKGENDPALSLKSRKARLVGAYDIDSWINSFTSTDSDGDQIQVTTNINGATGTRTIIETPADEGSTSRTQTITVNSASFTVEKDGTWDAVFNTTTAWTEEGDGVFVETIDYTLVETSTESGNWSFLGGQPEEFKNKERVLFSVINSQTSDQTTTVTNFEDGTSDTETSNLDTQTDVNANGEVSTIYEIDMLKGKEMKLVQNLDDTDNFSTTSGAFTFNFSVVTTGEMEITLTEN